MWLILPQSADIMHDSILLKDQHCTDLPMFTAVNFVTRLHHLQHLALPVPSLDTTLALNVVTSAVCSERHITSSG